MSVQGAIEHLLLRVSRLVEEVPEIAELDPNPLTAARWVKAA